MPSAPRHRKPTPNNFIRYYREDVHDWTLHELAARVGRSFQTVSRWEKTGDFKVAELEIVAAALSDAAKGIVVTPADLVPGQRALSDEEELLLRRYNHSSQQGKKAVMKVAESFAEGDAPPFTAQAPPGEPRSKKRGRG